MSTAVGSADESESVNDADNRSSSASERRASLSSLEKNRLSKEAENWAVANAVASVVDRSSGRKRLSFSANGGGAKVD